MLTKISLTSGYRTSNKGDFDQALPCNLEPVPAQSGISSGYVKSTPGAYEIANGPGVDRGGILWNDLCYRVMGTKLVSVNPSLPSASIITTLADVGSGLGVNLDYSFSSLIVNDGQNMGYWDGTAYTQVTDPNLGKSIDACWFQGQNFSTDGTYVLALDIATPTKVNSTSYGSAEYDPDGITGLIRLKDELYVMGQNTIEPQTYVGGSNFPLQSNAGAIITKGCVGRQAKCLYSQGIAFVGGGRNEASAVWSLISGTPTKLSTRIVDDLLAKVADQTTIQLESRVYRDEERLIVHLPTMSLMYLARASQKAQEPLWCILASGIDMSKAYRIRSAVNLNGQWIVGDTETYSVGLMTEAPGRLSEPRVFFSTSFDGQVWSAEKSGSLGKLGNRTKKVQFRPHRRFTNFLGMKFRGETGLTHFGEEAGWLLPTDFQFNQTNSAILHGVELTSLTGLGLASFAACTADIEALN